MRLTRWIFCALVLSWAAPASAAPITYNFSGAVTSAALDLETWFPGLLPGSDLSGCLTLDTEAPGLNATLLMDVGAHAFRGVGILSWPPGGGQALMASMSSHILTPVAGLYADSLHLMFGMERGAPTLGSVAFRGAGVAWIENHLIWREPGFNGDIDFRVPEPATGGLVLLGLAVMWWRRPV